MAKLENKTKENPKLEQNKLSDGRISLYLEYYLGREEKPVLDRKRQSGILRKWQDARKAKVRSQASQAKRKP